jgi:hypothetical protein
MILPQALPFVLFFYRQILLAWAQQIYLADALVHSIQPSIGAAERFAGFRLT